MGNGSNGLVGINDSLIRVIVFTVLLRFVWLVKSERHIAPQLTILVTNCTFLTYLATASATLAYTTKG